MNLLKEFFAVILFIVSIFLGLMGVVGISSSGGDSTEFVFAAIFIVLAFFLFKTARNMYKEINKDIKKNIVAQSSPVETYSFQEKYRKKHVFVSEYVVIDFETTGLDPAKNEIIEMAAVRFIDGKPAKEFQSLIKPKAPISKYITGITGITNEMVASSPSIEEALPHFIRFIGDSVIVAHNASFDMRFLLHTIGRVGFDHEVTNQVSDTVSMSRKYIPNVRNHKLPTLKKHLKLNNIKSHRAHGDCLVAGKVYWACKSFKEAQDQIIGG